MANLIFSTKAANLLFLIGCLGLSLESQAQSPDRQCKDEIPRRAMVQIPAAFSKSRVDVSAYGAIADGTGDNLHALTEALKNVPDSSTLFFPPGTYFLSKFVSINRSNIFITGQEATIILGGAANRQPSTGFYARAKHDIYFSNLHFKGFHRLYESAVWCTACKNVGVMNCTFDGIGFAGIMMANTSPNSTPDSGCSDSFVIDNVFRNIQDSAKNRGVAIFLFQGATHNTIAEDSIIGPGYVGIGIDDATVNSIVSVPGERNIVVGNSITGMTHSGIDVEGSNHTLVCGNNVTACRNGILLNNIQHQAPSDSNKVIGNMASQNAQNGLLVIGSSYNLIEDNRWTDNLQNGISIQTIAYGTLQIGSSRNVFRNNVISGNAFTSIVVRDTNCVLNEFETNTIAHNKVDRIFDGGLKTIVR